MELYIFIKGTIRQQEGYAVFMRILFVMSFLVMTVCSALAEDTAPEHYDIPDPGMGAVHLQVLGSSQGAFAYNAGLWVWRGLYANIDMTAIKGAEMGDVYGMDVAVGILPDTYILVPALGVVAGYNVDRQRPFLAMYPEISYVFEAGERSLVSILGRYYFSTEGMDEELFFYGLSINWIIDR